jgi:uncharacterized protein (TIGR02266 family)
MEFSYKQNRRSFERAPVSGPVRVETSDKTFAGFMVNISEGGLMIRTYDLPRPDERITLNFQLPSSDYSHSVKAVVVWVSHGRADIDLPKGMGVRFIELGDDDREHIRRYMDGNSENP